MNTEKKDLQRSVLNAALRLVVSGVGALGLAAALQEPVEGQVIQLSCSVTPAAIRWTANGPAGREFVVQGSADLKSWTPVFSDRFETTPCLFIDPLRAASTLRFYRAVLGTPGLELTDPSVTNAPPFSVLSLTASGLNLAAGRIYARFFDEHGFTAEAPAVEVSPGEVKFSVPAYLDPQSKEMAAGTVHVQVIQRMIQGDTISRTVHGFSIEDLPRPSDPPGAVVAHFLEGAANHAQTLLGELTGTPFDTLEMREALGRYAAQTTGLVESIRGVMRAPSSSVRLGTIADQPVTLDRRVLGNLDRLVLGFLTAQGAGEPAVGLTRSGAQGRIGNCARAEADAYAEALLHDAGSADAARSSYFGAHLGCTGAPFGIAYKVVAGAGGVALSLAVLAGAPAEALALASGALLYITVAGAGGLVALSGALGQESPAAAEMLQTGVDLMEDVLRGPVKSTVNEMAGAVLDLATSAASLKEAFSAVELDPGPMTGVRPATLQLGSVGGCGGGTLRGAIEVFAPAGVDWIVECQDQFEDPVLELSVITGTGPGTVSFSIVGEPQLPTPGFSCEDIGVLQFTSVLSFTFGNGEFLSVLVEYQYLLVL